MDQAGRKGGLAGCDVKVLLHLMLVRECQSSSVLRRKVQRRPTVISLGSITKVLDFRGISRANEGECSLPLLKNQNWRHTLHRIQIQTGGSQGSPIWTFIGKLTLSYI